MGRRNQDRGQHMYNAPASEANWDEGSPRRGSLSASPKRGIITLRGPRPETEPTRGRPAGPAEKTERPAKKEAEPRKQPEAKKEKSSESPPKGWLRRHPVLAPVGLIALLLAAAGGYLYWDHTAHFESTDDAFIAARQFAIAPKVAGYITVVPVTDNQHVNKGRVVAEIDQRDFRTALAQAEAQVAGAEAGIHNIDAQ